MSRAINLYNALETLVPRSTLWRMGRFLYLGARRELKNAPTINGEYAAIGQVLARCPVDQPIVLCDIGANFGHWSLEALEHAPRDASKIDIHLFEPAPDQRARLEANMQRVQTGEMGIHVHNLALAETQGELPFAVTGSESGNSALVPASATGDQATIKVPVSTLDDFMSAQGLKDVLFAKVDTEGNDFNVVLGAQAAFKSKSIAIMQIEYNWRWLEFGHFLRKVFEFVTPYGYRIGKLTGKGVEFYKDWHPELDRMIETNFVIVDASRMHLIDGLEYDFSNANVSQPTSGTK